MMRFRINGKLKQAFDYSNHISYTAWAVSEDQHKLIVWLRENVGEEVSSYYRFPFRGEGWIFFEGHSEDADPDDYSWRKLCKYTPKGEYGFWLQIDDDELGVMCRLSGLLDNEFAKR